MLGTRSAARLSGALFALLCGFAFAPACGDSTTASPFAPEPTASAGEGGAAGAESGTPTEPAPDPTLGAPCSDDPQCDDGLECTIDSCDRAVSRCRHAPDHSLCADAIYCDGVEQCEPGVGCREGEPVTCSDSDTCTLDRCVEADGSCEYRARDADGDGDGVWNCEGGGDCDDTDPRVASTLPEICSNDRDDDCDGNTDERDCESPSFDDCTDPFVIESTGTYALSLTAAAEDLPLGCVETGGARRDVVVALVVPEGPAVDVDVSVTADLEGLALALFEDCADESSERECTRGVEAPAGGNVARTILRGLMPGTYPVVVSAAADGLATLAVDYEAAPPATPNETCGTAAMLLPGAALEFTLANAVPDHESACVDARRDAVFEFVLEESQDVELSVAPLDDRGEPFVSLRDESCAELASELGCRTGAAVLFTRALPAGRYFAVVGSSGPSDVSVRLDVSDPTDAPAGEGCQDAPVLQSGQTEQVDLARRMDAVRTTCSVGAADAAYRLDLTERSDVLLVQRISAQDQGAISLMGASCASTPLVCEAGTGSPLRARAFGVREGEYRVVAESQTGSPLTVTAFTRTATPSVLVGLSDSCDEATWIDEAGGRFIGNTMNARADYEASCDYGGVPAGGAPDQVLGLRLDRPRRVVLDMQGSTYRTLLVVREGGGCGGRELPDACAPGYDARSRSYLDLTLDAGAYWVQIDGYDEASGAWMLDVFTADP